jgi:methylamine utilization protein MauE
VALDATLGATAQLLLAVVFLWAALAKAPTVSALAGTIERLGIAAPAARALAPAVVGAEAVTALGLFLQPGSWWPRAAVALLAVLFAAAGAVALVTGRRVACRCLGGGGRGRLGRGQLYLLPVWLGLAALAQWGTPGWSVDQGLFLLATVLIGVMAWRLRVHWPAIWAVRADRLAIASSYQNLGQTYPEPGEHQEHDGHDGHRHDGHDGHDGQGEERAG